MSFLFNVTNVTVISEQWVNLKPATSLSFSLSCSLFLFLYLPTGHFVPSPHSFFSLSPTFPLPLSLLFASHSLLPSFSCLLLHFYLSPTSCVCVCVQCMNVFKPFYFAAPISTVFKFRNDLLLFLCFGINWKLFPLNYIQVLVVNY